MLNLGLPMQDSRRDQSGINMVDLMMWLVIAALLLAAALQGIGYYQKTTYLSNMKSDASGVGSSVMSFAAVQGGTVDTKAVTDAANAAKWSKGDNFNIEQRTDGGIPYLRVSHDAVTSSDVVYLFDSCGSYGPGVNIIPKGGGVTGGSCTIGASPWIGGGKYQITLAGNLQFTKQPGGGDWISASVSGDGTKMVSGQYLGSIWTSSDSGNSWTERKSSGALPWLSVAISDSGSKIIASGGSDLYTSSDSGATWIKRIPSEGGAWRAVATSADGVKLVAVDNNAYIWTSTDSGATWTKRTTSGVGGWYSVASSSDGTKLIAGQASNGSVFVSTDSGATWTKSAGLPNGDYRGAATSDDGIKMVTANWSSGNIYTSTNSGSTWTARTAPGNAQWRNVASSADGVNLMAGQSNGDFFTSSDSGVTWTDQTAAGVGNWDSFYSSNDGKTILVAKGGAGGLYVGKYLP